ncbi:MAG TPA: hypothetical protein VNY05_02885 [Candidatus Acidoferrales bacterium]|nr:hypothetical protein [Candidatus Acidoferrales bacterium]
MVGFGRAGNEGVLARINELKTSIFQGVVEFEIRSRSVRVQILQNQLDDMLDLQRARALLYADHPEGSTGLVVKGYRGQKAKKEIWKFDAALVTQILKTLKQAAIEVGEWNEKRVPQESQSIDSLRDRIMPVLHNSKHERFARCVAKGLSHREAYSSVGYSKAERVQTLPTVTAEIRCLFFPTSKYDRSNW